MTNQAEIKYTDRDVRENPDLEDVVEDYLEQYQGEFQYLIDCKMRVAQGERLTVGHVRGVLNCMRVDPRVLGLPDPLPATTTVITFNPGRKRQREVPYEPYVEPDEHFPWRLPLKATVHRDLVKGKSSGTLRYHKVSEVFSEWQYYPPKRIFALKVRPVCGYPKSLENPLLLTSLEVEEHNQGLIDCDTKLLPCPRCFPDDA